MNRPQIVHTTQDIWDTCSVKNLRILIFKQNEALEVRDVYRDGGSLKVGRPGEEFSFRIKKGEYA